MRIGENTNRDKCISDSDYFHQIVFPVYIPHLSGYYKDSFEILRICLQSVLNTVHSKTFVTLVSNGSCDEVNEYLNQLKQAGKIHELIVVGNIGKINSILKAIVGSKFSLVTISDADVLFLPGWQEATYEIFESFPKAGVVCPMPNPGLNFDLTGNVLSALGSNYTSSYEVVNDTEALIKFAESTNSLKLLHDKLQLKNLFVYSNGTKAGLGASHFVCTYRNEALGEKILRFSNYLLGGDSEKVFLDSSILKYDLWRLSTPNSFVYHMGNTYQEWYTDKLELSQTYVNKKQEVRLHPFPKLNGWDQQIVKLKNKIFNSTRYRIYFKRKFNIPI